MCPELILALLYFFTILTVNYFLFKLLKSYLTNIFYLLNIKNIFTNFSKTDVKIISFLYFLKKNEFKNLTIFNFIQKFSKVNDNLVVGKTYEYIAKNIEQTTKKENSLIYYLRLLENQYLM